MTIEDDGCGCPATAPDPEADGLHNTQRRMTEFGGTFQKTRTPGASTTVTMRVPLDALAMRSA